MYLSGPSSSKLAIQGGREVVLVALLINLEFVLVVALVEFVVGTLREQARCRHARSSQLCNVAFVVRFAELSSFDVGKSSAAAGPEGAKKRSTSVFARACGGPQLVHGQCQQGASTTECPVRGAQKRGVIFGRFLRPAAPRPDLVVRFSRWPAAATLNALLLYGAVARRT